MWDPESARPISGKLWLGVLAILLISGCAATIELAAPEADAAAKTFIPVQGTASIYVTRKDQFTGSAVLFQVVIDGRVKGGIAPGTYHMATVDPGTHTVSVTTMENQSSQTVNAVAGESYFFQVKPKMGMLAARAEITPLTKDEGRAAIIENSLAQDLYAEN